MEGAFNELYQAFLRLRSLCLKQAALIQQLTMELKRQGGCAAGGGQGVTASILVQCSQGNAKPMSEISESQRASSRNQDLASSEVAGTTSALLGKDMERLQLDGTNTGIERNALRQIDQQSSDEPTQRIPRLCGSYLDSDFLTINGGMLMSEIALQSLVCEFCHAVFPGHTTTISDFVRHLHVHIS